MVRDSNWVIPIIIVLLKLCKHNTSISTQIFCTVMSYLSSIPREALSMFYRASWDPKRRDFLREAKSIIYQPMKQQIHQNISLLKPKKQYLKTPYANLKQL